MTGDITDEQRRQVIEGLEELSRNFKAFVISNILNSVFPTFDEYQIDATCSQDLADAHTRLMIKAPLDPYHQSLLHRLDIEHSEITETELLVSEKFFNLFIS